MHVLAKTIHHVMYKVVDPATAKKTCKKGMNDIWKIDIRRTFLGIKIVFTLKSLDLTSVQNFLSVCLITSCSQYGG